MAAEEVCSAKVRLHLLIRARETHRLLAEMEVVKTLGWGKDDDRELLRFDVPVPDTAWGEVMVPVMILNEPGDDPVDYWCTVEVEPQHVREWTIKRDADGVAMSVVSETYNTR